MWNKDKTLKLIKHFKICPVLWHYALREYCDRDKNIIAIKKIADSL